MVRVEFKEPIDAKVVNYSHKVQNQEILVERYFSNEETEQKLEEEKDRKIFVGGLPENLDSEGLRKYFQDFGDVEHANVVVSHENMKSRKFGFVIFKTLEDVEKVLKEDHFITKKVECYRFQMKSKSKKKEQQSLKKENKILSGFKSEGKSLLRRKEEKPPEKKRMLRKFTLEP